jgi:3-oxoacyl-[acyl-carrier-protein] synthase II
MERKRIVITGMGLVSCFGTDVDVFYNNLLQGKSGVNKISGFDTSAYTTQIAAEVRDFDATLYLDRKQARRVDKCIAYTIAAGKLACQMAKLTPDCYEHAPQRYGCLVGSGMGGMATFVENTNQLASGGPRRVSPFLIPYILTNMGSGMLAQELGGWMGPNYSISTACATGNNCIIAAAEHLRRGDADAMLCGGVEAAIIPLGLAGFCAIKALSQRNDEPQRASRPWDTGRDGFVMGEGAGVLLLETLEHAERRGATILAEYLGGAVNCDGYHITDPRPDGSGVAQCVEYAMADAGVTAADINYINAHATSTPVGDIAEINALKRVFTDPSAVAINATKSLIGHCLGAAGGIEAIATVMAITKGVLHPTLNLENPEANLGFTVPTQATPWQVRAALSNSFGFGGHNAVLILAPYAGR